MQNTNYFHKFAQGRSHTMRMSCIRFVCTETLRGHVKIFLSWGNKMFSCSRKKRNLFPQDKILFLQVHILCAQENIQCPQNVLLFAEDHDIIYFAHKIISWGNKIISCAYKKSCTLKINIHMSRQCFRMFVTYAVGYFWTFIYIIKQEDSL